MKKILSVAIILSSFLYGCATDTTIYSKPIEKTPLNLDNSVMMSMNPIEVNVISSTVPVIVLRKEDYQNLIMNMEQIRSYIIEQNEIIKSYKNYYESPIDKSK